MRFIGVTAVALCSLGLIQAQDAARRAWQLESKGDAAGARATLQRESQSGSPAPDALKAYAEFLDRHHDPGARQAYERLLAVSQGPDRQAVARRLVLLDIFAEDRAAAGKDIAAYREAGGPDLVLPQPAAAPGKDQVILIPGPLRSFARMAALSPDLI